jgi:hypothetical protein
MPRPKSPPRVKAIAQVARIAISSDQQRRIARALGRDNLPDDCVAKLTDVLEAHVKVSIGQRRSGTTPRNVMAAVRTTRRIVERARESVAALIALDSGVDFETADQLESAAKAFVDAADSCLARLHHLPRIRPHTEALRATAPILARLFRMYANPDFRGAGHMRRFAYEALLTTGLPFGIDGSHLDRLDEFLHAAPIPISAARPM